MGSSPGIEPVWVAFLAEVGWRQRARAIDRDPPLVPVRLGSRTRWLAVGRWRAYAWAGTGAHSGELAPVEAWERASVDAWKRASGWALV